MAIDFLRHLRFISVTPEVRAGTLKVEVSDTGDISFRSIADNRVFRHFNEARAYVRDFLALTEADVYTGDQPMFGGPTFMRLMARDLELADPGVTVQRLAFNLKNMKDKSDFEKLYMKDGIPHGWATVDNEKAVLTRVIRSDGSEYTSEEIFDFAKRSRGLDQGFLVDAEGRGMLDQKYGKRANTFVKNKMYEMATTDPITIGIYDAKKGMDLSAYETQVRRLLDEDKGYLASVRTEARNQNLTKEQAVEYELRKAANQAVDGFSEGSIDLFYRMRDFHEEVEGELTEVLRRRFGDFNEEDLRRLVQESGDLDLMRVFQERNLMQKKTQELDRIIRRGAGVFNLRATGLEAVNLDPTNMSESFQGVFNKMQRMGFQIKGNIILNISEEFQRLGVHIRAHYEDVKFEMGMQGRMIDGRFVDDLNQMYFDKYGMPRRATSHVTLSHLNEAMNTIIDAQTAASFPEFYTREMIEEGGRRLLKQFDEMIELASQPYTPSSQSRLSPFLAILESQMDSTDHVVRENARQILAFLDAGGTIADNPALMKRVVHNLAQSLVRERGGLRLPKIEVPASIRAEVAPRAKMVKQPHLKNILSPENHKAGYTVFDPKSQTWIIHESDSITIHHALGGFDYDDAVNAMIRYDPNDPQNRLKVLMTRQPTARGEWALFNIYDDAEVVHEILRKTVDYDSYKEAVKNRKKLQKRIKSLSNVALKKGGIDPSTEILQLERDLARADELIEDVFRRNIPEMPTKLPWRRAFDEHGDYLGYRKIHLAGGGYRFFGEPSELIYQTIPGMKGGDVTRILGSLTDDQRIQALSGMMARLEGMIADPTGIWSNARMFFDHWYATHEQTIRQHDVLHGKVIALTGKMFEQETILDAYAQGLVGGKGIAGAEKVQTVAGQLIEGTTEIAALGRYYGVNVGMDPTLIDAKGQENLIRKGLESANQKIREELAKQGIVDPDVVQGHMVTREMLLMPDSHMGRTFGALQQVVGLIDERVDAVVSQVSLPAWMLEMEDVRTATATRDARAIIQAEREIRESLQKYRVTDDFFGRVSLPGKTLGFMTKSQLHDHVAEELTEYATRFFEGGEAGPRLYRAIIRAAQIIEASPLEQKRYDILEALQPTGLLPDAFRWGKATSEGRQVLMSHKTLDDIHSVYQRLTREAFRGVMEDILREADVTMEMAQDIQRGVTGAMRRDPHVPGHISRQLLGQEGAAILPFHGELMGPLDPSTVVRLPGEHMPVNLGRLAFEFHTRPEARDRIRRQVVEAVTGFHDVMTDWATSSRSMPRYLWEEVVRSLDRSPERAEKAFQAKQVAEDIGELKFKRGFRNLIRDVAGTTYGKAGAGITAAMAALAVIHTVRKRDHSINDMQGSAFMPGENPYQDRVPAPEFNQQTVYMPEPQTSGTTYQIRTRGGRYDDDFVSALGGITGGSVSGSVYDTLPLQTERTRLQILQSYR